jgi:exopolysaccharide production protein ExoZ
VLVWLGEMSYSLYLTHMVALWAMADVAPRLGLHNLELTSILDIGLCLLIGWLCWRWVEKPLTSRAQRLARQISIREGSLPG